MSGHVVALQLAVSKLLVIERNGHASRPSEGDSFVLTVVCTLPHAHRYD